LNNKGFCLLYLERYGEALKVFNEAIKIDPNYKPKEMNQIETSFFRSIGYPDLFNIPHSVQGRSWYGKGKCLEKMQMEKEAQIAFKKAQELDYY
jgi:tetratricopeptide (TPR) repeat protein